MDLEVNMKAIKTYVVGACLMVLTLHAHAQEPAWRLQLGGTLAGGNYVLKRMDGTQFQRPPATGPIWGIQLMASYRVNGNWGVSFGAQFLEHYSFSTSPLYSHSFTSTLELEHWDRWIMLPVLANWESSGEKLKYFAEMGTGVSIHIGTWQRYKYMEGNVLQQDFSKISDKAILGPMILANAGIRYSITQQLATRLSVGALYHLGFYTNTDFGYFSILSGHTINAGLAVEWQF